MNNIRLTLSFNDSMIIAMGRVLVFGSINTDLVTYVEKLPSPGETVTGGRFATFAGGKGANQAVAASRAGADVTMFGAVGDDSYGRERLDDLKNDGIDVGGIIVKKGIHSGIAQIIVGARGENLIAVASGANFEFSENDVEVPSVYGSETVVLFQNELKQDTTEVFIRHAKENGYTVLWNIAPMVVKSPSMDTLKSLDYLICNEIELKGLVEILGIEGNRRSLDYDFSIEEYVRKMAGAVIDLGIKNVLVTLGPRGAVLINEKEKISHGVYDVVPVDTVGAGDCFVGVFAASLSKGMSTREALKFASAAASISVTKEGAQASMPTEGEIKEFLRKN